MLSGHTTGNDVKQQTCCSWSVPGKQQLVTLVTDLYLPLAVYCKEERVVDRVVMALLKRISVRVACENERNARDQSSHGSDTCTSVSRNELGLNSGAYNE